MSFNFRMKNNTSFNKEIKYKRDEEKKKKIRSILGYDDEILNGKRVDSKIKVKYNQTVYFEQPQNIIDKNSSEKKLEKFISNVFNNSNNPPLIDKIEKGSNIKFNFNINNNYYNSNYNVLESKNERAASYNVLNTNNSYITNNIPRMTHYNPSFNCNYYLYLLIFTSKINIYEYIIITSVVLIVLV